MPERTTGAIEEAVAGLDRVVNGVGTGVIVDLPQTEANKRHLPMSATVCIATNSIRLTSRPLFSLIVGATILA